MTETNEDRAYEVEFLNCVVDKEDNFKIIVSPLLPDRPRTGMTHFLNFLKGCACKLAKHSLSCYVNGSSLFHTSLKKSAKRIRRIFIQMLI